MMAVVEYSRIKRIHVGIPLLRNNDKQVNFHFKFLKNDNLV
jgi:hypothetical protein